MKPRVLVTDAGRPSAIAAIRSLGRAGWDVVAADSDPRSPGFYSRYARWRLRYPSPDHDPTGIAETIQREIRKRSVDLVIPVTDDVILPLCRIRDELEKITVVAMPEPEVLAVVSDKTATLRVASELGIPIPRTQIVHGISEARRHIADVGWPVVLKPPTSRTYGQSGRLQRHEVTYASSDDELVSMMRRHGERPILVQEFCVGEGHGVELLLREGRPLAAFQHRRLREVPITGGASSFRESVPIDAGLYGHAVTLLERLRYTGLAMVEFRVGPSGARLMEVNGRIWGSLALASKSGVDFPLLMARMYLGLTPNGDPAVARYQMGTRSRNLALEISWIGSVLAGRRTRFPPTPERSEALRVALRLFLPSDGYDVLSADDPLPGLAELAKIVRTTVRRLGNRP